MAEFTDGDRYSAKAEPATDLSTKKGYVVKFNSSKQVILATASTDKFIGVLEDGGRVVGDNVSIVAVNGVGSYKGIAGGVVALGDYLTSNGSGKLIATTTSTHHVLGQALGAAVDGQQVEYLKKDFIIA